MLFLFEYKWFYMKYIGKYLSAEILLTCDDNIPSTDIDIELNLRIKERFSMLR